MTQLTPNEMAGIIAIIGTFGCSVFHTMKAFIKAILFVGLCQGRGVTVDCKWDLFMASFGWSLVYMVHLYPNILPK